MMKLSTLALMALAGLACKPTVEEANRGGGDSSAFTSQDVVASSDFSDASSYQGTIRQDLKEQFCIHVYRRPLKADFSNELGYLCTDNKPNETFDLLDKYSSKVGDKPRSIKLALEHDGDRSEGVFATVYGIDIQPKWVRSADIGSFMIKDSFYDYVQLDGSVVENLDSTLGGDLQFGKSRLSYKTDITTPDGNQFSNERLTELNSFQVHGGNSHIGIGSEHLVSSPNDDYTVYNTITVTIGTENDGSVLITIIRVNVNNNGYPDVSEKVMSDLATAQATHVRANLLSKLRDKILSQ